MNELEEQKHLMRPIKIDSPTDGHPRIPHSCFSSRGLNKSTASVPREEHKLGAWLQEGKG
jgi:hypothetical protein